MDINLVNNAKGIERYKAINDGSTFEKIEKNTDEKDGITKKDINKAVNELNKYLKKENTYAKYDVHEKLGDIMIKIIDEETKKVIMEFPPEKILDMVAKLCEDVGIVFNKKA